MRLRAIVMQRELPEEDKGANVAGFPLRDVRRAASMSSSAYSPIHCGTQDFNPNCHWSPKL